MSLDLIVKILYAFAAAFLGIIIIIIIKRKLSSGKGISTDDSGTLKARRMFDTSKFIPVESIRDKMVILTGEQRYIASINCKGFDLYSADVEEQYRTQEGYLSFINTIQSPVTLRIDSTAVDLTASIKRHEEALVKTREELQRCYEEFAQYKRLVMETENDNERAMYANSLYEIQRRGICLENQVKHLEHLIKYQENLSGKAANPIQEERYFIDWTFNPVDFPKSITKEEIEEHARKELNSRIEQMKHALARANIKCTRDDDAELFNLSYRHFHPYSSDIYRNKDNTNYHDKIVSGERNFRDAQRRFLRARDDKYIRELIEKQTVAHEDNPVFTSDAEVAEQKVRDEGEQLARYERPQSEVEKALARSEQEQLPSFKNVVIDVPQQKEDTGDVEKEEKVIEEKISSGASPAPSENNVWEEKEPLVGAFPNKSKSEGTDDGGIEL